MTLSNKKSIIHVLLLTELFELINLNMQVERYNLDKVLMKGTVAHIRPVIEDKDGGKEESGCMKEDETNNVAMRVTDRNGDRARKRVKYFEVQLQEGVILKAHQVVMATGPTRAQMANIPSWVTSIGESYPEERLQHTVHLMHHLPIAQQNLKESDCQRQKETFPIQGKSESLLHGRIFNVLLLPDLSLLLHSSVAVSSLQHFPLQVLYVCSV